MQAAFLVGLPVPLLAELVTICRSKAWTVSLVSLPLFALDVGRREAAVSARNEHVCTGDVSRQIKPVLRR